MKNVMVAALLFSILSLTAFCYADEADRAIPADHDGMTQFHQDVATDYLLDG